MVRFFMREKLLIMRFNRGDVHVLRDIYAIYKDEDDLHQGFFWSDILKMFAVPYCCH